MFKNILPLAAALAIVSSSALAGHCPRDVKKIDSALSDNSNLSVGMQTKSKSLRDKGDQLHKSGRHGDSLKALHEAMAVLEIQH